MGQAQPDDRGSISSSNQLCGGLALARFEATLSLVDHVDAALTAHNAAITVTVLQRFNRAADFHRSLSEKRGK